MNNLTKFRIARPAHDLFEAFADPAKIGNFWFSSSSERWEKGKSVTLIYKEYNAEVGITLLDVEADKKIVFQWAGEENIVTITLEEQPDESTIIAINEEGFHENDPELLSKIVDNKEGWVFVLSCLKGYMEFGVTALRTGIVK
ncbi:SRPBCC family protein [Paenibacillus lignilyticus]|uniref:SRPBCC family protein n=1 Tax=Paenibacillus lignilyticus TaxID=1172615 RepID=A0ABS5CHS3_9BACL|nr:SRPBCC family protein [Paenibacillus lignilyticus]MBP3965395.1 SRPBCC family protein [Paenibacillus lignilyticus]